MIQEYEITSIHFNILQNNVSQLWQSLEFIARQLEINSCLLNGS